MSESKSKEAEIAQLKRELAHWVDMAAQADVACVSIREEIIHHKNLHALAADALEEEFGPPKEGNKLRYPWSLMLQLKAAAR